MSDRDVVHAEDRLFRFLQSLETKIPPVHGCHHNVTVARYGSDADGWEDRLALNVRGRTLWHTYWLDAGDIDNIEATIAFVMADIFADLWLQ